MPWTPGLRSTFPTPGVPNLRLYQGFVEKPQFSAPHGFYSSEIQVSITVPDARGR